MQVPKIIIILLSNKLFKKLFQKPIAVRKHENRILNKLQSKPHVCWLASE